MHLYLCVLPHLVWTLKSDQLLVKRKHLAAMSGPITNQPSNDKLDNN